jgi:von Willebrand factor type A domain
MNVLGRLTPHDVERYIRRVEASNNLVRLALLALTLGACGGLQLQTIKTAEQRPSNVAIYFKVQTRSGEPVAGLSADAFRIYEDRQLVSQYESKQTILNPEVAAAHYTLLLVDMSGSVTESGAIDTLIQAAGIFTDRVEKQEKVGVYAFAGDPDLYPIVPFTDQAASAKSGLGQLATFKPKDPSTNLNGAVVKALDQLDASLGRASQPLKFGTLVVFTDGTDRASRVSASAMEQHVREKPFDVFAIGLGGEIKPSELAAIGKNGTAMAADGRSVVKAFDDIGARVEGRTRSYYLLSYCSPARAGQHRVRIEAALKNPQGNNEQTGSVDSEFDATGFAPGCDPNTPPSFDVTRGDALAPKPPAAPPDSSKTKDVSKPKDLKKESRPAPRSPPVQPPAPPATQSPESPPQPPSENPDFNP